MEDFLLFTPISFTSSLSVLFYFSGVFDIYDNLLCLLGPFFISSFTYYKDFFYGLVF